MKKSRLKQIVAIVLAIIGITKISLGQPIEETTPGSTHGNLGSVKFNYGGVEVIYTTVRAKDGNVWLQQNLGSSRVATGRVDGQSFGDLFQWGRWDDGHHLRTGGTLSNTPPSPNNPIGLNKTGINEPFYFNATAANRWWAGGVSTDNAAANDTADITATNGCDPCKKIIGGDWRLPTKDEWDTLRTAEEITNADAAFASLLKIPSANPRFGDSGNLQGNNNTTRLWSGTAGNGGGAFALNFTYTGANAGTASVLNIARTTGFPVRCVKKPLWVSAVKYQDASTGIFLGSPSLLKLSNGDILASYDYNGTTSNTTGVYRSTDNGVNWTHITDITGLFWANLFEHQGNIYFLGTNAGAGVTSRTIVICRSTDNGATWSTPVTLFDEDIPSQPVRYHCAPTPVVKHNGRLFRAFEALDTQFPWARGYRAFVISIAEDTDLMVASNWKMGTKVTYNAGWDPPGSDPETTGWIEGNVVVDPLGKLLNIIRVNSVPYVDKAAIIRISDDGNSATFTPDDFIEFPGGLHKFVIRPDTVTGIYLAMVNNNTNPAYPQQRNILSLYGSTNLRNWHHIKTLMEDDQGLPFSVSVAKTGFQYADWHFDGDDLIYLVRTSYDGAYNYHNANRITFGRLENFRSYMTTFPPDPPVTPPPLEKIPDAGEGSTGYVRLVYNNHEVVYTTVRAKDGNVWLQQNLGSSNVATAQTTDQTSWGDLFQWGRWDDGHQYRSGLTTSSTPPSPNNPSGLSNLGLNPFYFNPTTSNRWWGGGTSTDKVETSSPDSVSATNGCDPCKKLLGEQWRLPTIVEWETLRDEEEITNNTTAFGSNLKIPSITFRDGSTGALNSNTNTTRLWSSTAGVSGGAYLLNLVSAGATTLNISRGNGYAVRCVREEESTTPVGFINFKSKSDVLGINLEWAVVSEHNNAYYTVKHSPDGISFKSLADISGRGDSSTQQTYTYLHHNPFSGTNYYKLSQTDSDGTQKELSTIVVLGKTLEKEDIIINATDLSVKVMLVGFGSKPKKIAISSISGQNIYVERINDESVILPIVLKKGGYVARVDFEDNTFKTVKFIK